MAHLEEVLDIYHLPYDPDYPVICMDEKPFTLHEDVREGFTSERTGITYEDEEYARKGTCAIFMFTQPLTGWDHVDAFEHRTRTEWALQVRSLVDEWFPEAKKIRLVMDNLNTHGIASLYATFPPEEACRIARKLEIHHTPKHGSWLNQAECALSVLERQCLYGRRIGTVELLNKELHAWQDAHNALEKIIYWMFTKEDSRIRMRKLYPLILEAI